MLDEMELAPDGQMSTKALLVVVDVLAVVAVVLIGGVAVGWGLAAGAVLLLSRWAAGLYRPRLALGLLDELPRTLLAAALAVGAVAVASSLTPFVDRAVVVAVLWMGLALLGGRTAGYLAIRRLRRRGLLQTRVLLVGSGDVAQLIEEQAEASPELGLQVCGRMSAMSQGDIPLIVHGYDAHCVILAFGRDPEGSELPAIREALQAGVCVYAVPRYHDLISDSRADDRLWRVPLVRLGAPAHPRSYALKRAFDIFVASVALLLTAPLILTAGFLVRRETGGGMIFRQERVGRGGVRFDLFKLQTLRPETKAESETHWNISQDDRLGPVGRLLRKTSIDELPQLWNVLRGDMSIVGPRPERPFYVEKFSAQIPHYASRHRMPVGLTGLAQIHGLRGDTCISERASFDNLYVDNWSVWQDVKIVIKTVPSVLKGAGG